MNFKPAGEVPGQSRLPLGDRALDLLLDIEELSKDIAHKKAQIKERREMLAQLIDEARETRGGG